MSATPRRLAAPPEAADDDPPVEALMTRRLVGIVPDAPLGVALRQMIDNGVRHLPVMVGGRYAGLLRETDIVRAIADGAFAALVGEVCRSVPTVGAAARRSTAARLMTQAGTDAVVVLDGEGVVGIVTAADVVGSLGRSR